jgi:hypothetical protein
MLVYQRVTYTKTLCFRTPHRQRYRPLGSQKGSPESPKPGSSRSWDGGTLPEIAAVCFGWGPDGAPVRER